MDAYVDPASRIDSPSKPKRGFLRGKIRFFVLAVVIAGAIIGANFHLRANQTLSIFNELEGPATVQVDGLAPFTVGPHQRRNISLAEGKHRALITRKGEPEETVTFAIRNTMFQRFNGHAVFILNVAGAGVFVWEEIVYSEDEPDTTKPKAKLFFGDTFLELRDVHYAFEEPPETIMVDIGKAETRTAVNLITGSAEEMEGLLQEIGQGHRVKAFRDHQSRLYPGRSKMQDAAKAKAPAK